MVNLLSENVKPVNYKIHWEPQFQGENDTTFIGNETIHMRVQAATSKIVLHAKNMEVSNVRYTHNDVETRVDPTAITYDKESETVSLDLGRDVQGDIYVHMDFSGELKGVEGLHKSMYTHDGETRYMLTTQFEAADARAAFPSFDEPSAKATYDISVTLDEGLKAISNTDAVSEEPLGDGRKTVTFGTTPVMSSYLLYLGAGEFESIEKKVGNTTVRVISTPGKIDKGQYALDAAAQFLQFYQDYFGIEYELDKMDNIAVPDFGFGAMENWGAITYREDRLLGDPDEMSLAAKRSMLTTIAHEIVHQWFGNLATMHWWNDLWLNESFADYMAFKAVDKFFPEVDPWSDFLGKKVTGAFELDSLKNSHPIDTEVKSPADIGEIFDAISYSKGGMVLRMLEKYLGEEVFKRGLHEYLVEKSFANGEGHELWAKLEEVSDKPVSRIMDSWVNKIGYPVVYADLTEDGLRLEQKRLTYLDNDDETLWEIPMTISVDGNDMPVRLMSDKSEVVEIPDGDLVKVNVDQSGFLRVKYSPSMLKSFEIGLRRLGHLDRWGVHSDMAALAIAGEVEVDDYLGFVERAFDEEKSYLVLSDIVRGVSYFSLLSSDSDLPHLQARIRNIYNSILDRIGWDKQDGDEETTPNLRSSVMLSLGRLNDSRVLSIASGSFDAYLSDPSSVDADFRATMFKLVAWQGDEETYEKMLGLYRKATADQDLHIVNETLSALAGFSDEKLLGRTLDFLLTDEVRDQNVVYSIVGLAGNPTGRKMTWPWIRDQWDKVETYAKKFPSHFRHVIKSMNTMADVEAGKDVGAFFAEHPIEGTTKAIAQLQEKLHVNANVVDRLG